MQARTLALIFAATVIASGCVSKETKPEPAPTPVTATATTVAVAETAPVASKPECPPEPSSKAKLKTKTTKKSKAKKKAEPVAVDCEPAKPQAAASNTKASQAVTAPVAAAPAKEADKPTEAGKARSMKSVDGTFEGDVYGNIPPNSKWAKLQIGMEQAQVERILGGTSQEVRTHPTAKAFIPFYYGTDRYRYEVVYRGQGSVSYTGGSWGAGAGILMMINYDPKI